MNESPTSREVPCPECNALATAIVPKGARVADSDEDADGKVWTPCRECGERFLVYFEIEGQRH